MAVRFATYVSATMKMKKIHPIESPFRFALLTSIASLPAEKKKIKTKKPRLFVRGCVCMAFVWPKERL